MAPAGDFSTNFFSYMTESATIFPKPEMYFLLETKHKFGFSFLKEKKKKEAQLYWYHSTVYFCPICCFERFYGTLSIGCPSSLFIMDTFVNIDN